MARSPKHCKQEMDNPREATAEMAVGSGLHVSILEPARFAQEFYIAPSYDGRTTEGQAIAAACEELAAGRTIIRIRSGDQVDADDMSGMAREIWQHPGSRKLLSLPGQCEVSALWKDPVTGLLCKGRFDKLLALKPPTILELKSDRDTSLRGFAKNARKLYYSAQAAYYLWGHEILTGQKAGHVFVAVENKPPHAVATYMLSDADMQWGTSQFRAWLDRYADCVKSGKWPGYSEQIEILDLDEH